MRRSLSFGLVTLVFVAATIVSAAAQPFMGSEASRVIRAANVLSARIAAYHRGPGSWTGYTPVPPGYCGTMREGEAVMKELARFAIGWAGGSDATLQRNSAKQRATQ